jgi:hypothetical protein
MSGSASISLGGTRSQTVRSSGFFNRYNEKENYYDVGHKTRRPHKMNERETRNAACQLASGRAHNATHLREEFFPDLNVSTVKRHLKESGLAAHIRRSMPLITAPNLKK